MGSWMVAGVENYADFSREVAWLQAPADQAWDCQPRSEFRGMRRPGVGKLVDIVCDDGALPVQTDRHKMLCSSRKIPLDGEVVSGIFAHFAGRIVSY